MKRYDFTATEKWLNSYSVREMADALKDNVLNLVYMGLDKVDCTDPKEHVLHMMEAVNFVCSFLNTIKVEEVEPINSSNNKWN